MLEQTALQIKEGVILGIKITTGEEIIGRIKSVNKSDIILEKPHTIMISQAGAGLSPWPMIAQDDSDVGIARSNIVAFFPPREDFAEYYAAVLDGTAEDEVETKQAGIIMPGDAKIIT